MALIRPYEDSCGNSYTGSYWRAVSINIASFEQKITLVFFGWKDGTAFQNGKQPLSGAVKNYSVTGADFLAVATAPPVGASLYDVLANAVEKYALNKADTPSGQLDQSGKPVMVSFFAGATQV